MNRKEQIQKEHQGRVERMRIDSTLPRRVMPQQRWSMRGIVLILLGALVLVGVAVWTLFGGI